jgi:voltage-gated potassium channel
MNNSTTPSSTLWQLVILGLSVYVLEALLLDTVLSLPPDVRNILQVSDTAICFVFIMDFFVRFVAAKHKWQFLKWGWIDLVSSIPMLDYFRVGRMVRVIRILRILRAFRSTKILLTYLFANRAKSVFACAALISFTLTVFSSIAILNVEDSKDSNIKNAEDALWWAIATITTVGYGDKYPVTTEGRIIGAFLMAGGVGLFGTFTGFVASWFMSPGQAAIKKEEEKIEAEEERIEEKLEKVEKLLAEIKGSLGKRVEQNKHKSQG